MSDTKTNHVRFIISEAVVQQLVANQFPQWRSLLIHPVVPGGWDHQTFRLGDDMLIRLPSAEQYAEQVEKEQEWLPKLGPLLPLSIPEPLALGEPNDNYPCQWSIYRWIEGEPVTMVKSVDLSEFARRLAEFLITLQGIDTSDAPLSGAHNFYRGGSLSNYDAQTRQAIAVLEDKIAVRTATEIWERAIESTWCHSPVWVHGDISASNLLVRGGQLVAVIDFGLLAVGDPACDLAIAWTLFKGKSRDVFRSLLPLDEETWMRARAWVLWKFLVVAAGLTDWDAVSVSEALSIIDDVLSDH